MKFTIQPGLILFHDDKVGAHATMLGPTGKLSFRDDACVFHDADQSYAWAFEWTAGLKKGQVFVFATTDREAVGEVDAMGEIVISDRKVTVKRDVDGVPVKFTKKLFR